MRNASSAFLIVDAQSVKNTDTADLKGYYAGKYVSGIKRQQERKPAAATLKRIESNSEEDSVSH